ncbi:hypothetical protein [Paraburkholderia kururiensis]|uniref:hypothetical protein n=1 Tax=Paraburkholderia kururiensis TaxID=984307 RepID=UPI0012E08EDA|nr:hypothetical protein [Paraburkholderia kururiensis]
MIDSAAEWFEERAAIMQFDGGKPRYEAEFDAFASCSPIAGGRDSEGPMTRTST